MAGRRITYAEIEEVARRLVRGMRVESVAAATGVSRASIYSWLKDGNPELDRAMREARIAKVRDDCSADGWAPMIGVGKATPVEPLPDGGDDRNVFATNSSRAHA